MEKETKYVFSFDQHFGFAHGQALELVYPVNTAGGLLSELRWDMKPVYYLGLNTGISRRDIMSGPGFFTNISFKFGIPGDTGSMEDRDWMSIENGGLTHFSCHTNHTNEFICLDAVAGVSFPVRTFLYLKPFISGSWMRFSFSARDGMGQYARKTTCTKNCESISHLPGCPAAYTPNETTYHSINDNPHYYPFDGFKVITYTQDWLVIAAGFTAGTKALYPFLIDFSFKISPFTYCAAADEHLIGNTVFMDFTGWGLYLEPQGSISLAVRQLEFSLGLQYRYIGNTRGRTFIKHGESGFVLEGGKAGAGLSMLNAWFLIRLKN